MKPRCLVEHRPVAGGTGVLRLDSFVGRCGFFYSQISFLNQVFFLLKGGFPERNNKIE